MNKATREVTKSATEPSMPLARGVNYVLAIAIDEYLHKAKLNNCIRDVDEIVTLLVELYDFAEENVIRLYNEAATRTNIIETLDGYVECLGQTDTLLVLFSGHGIVRKRIGYWIPVEARSFPEYLEVSTVKHHLDPNNARHVVVIADACFAGSFFRQTRATVDPADFVERHPSRYALTAGRDEPVSDGEPGRNSPFADSLKYRLSSATQPIGIVRLAEQVTFDVLQRVEGSQTPQHGHLNIDGNRHGQFFFRRKPLPATPTTEPITNGSAKDPLGSPDVHRAATTPAIPIAASIAEGSVDDPLVPSDLDRAATAPAIPTTALTTEVSADEPLLPGDVDAGAWAPAVPIRAFNNNADADDFLLAGSIDDATAQSQDPVRLVEPENEPHHDLPLYTNIPVANNPAEPGTKSEDPALILHVTAGDQLNLQLNHATHHVALVEAAVVLTPAPDLPLAPGAPSWWTYRIPQVPAWLRRPSRLLRKESIAALIAAFTIGIAIIVKAKVDASYQARLTSGYLNAAAQAVEQTRRTIAEEDARKKADEDARKKADEDARKKADEERDRRTPAEIDGLQRHGMFQLEAYQYKEALKTGEELIKADPKNAAGYFIRGAALLKLGHEAEAVQCFKDCVRESKKGPIGQCERSIDQYKHPIPEK